MIDVELIFVHQTENGFCVAVDEDAEDTWLPKSEVEADEEMMSGDVHTFTMPERLAVRKGLI